MVRTHGSMCKSRLRGRWGRTCSTLPPKGETALKVVKGVASDGEDIAAFFRPGQGHDYFLWRRHGYFHMPGLPDSPHRIDLKILPNTNPVLITWQVEELSGIEPGVISNRSHTLWRQNQQWPGR